jgi:hypothetical protein
LCAHLKRDLRKLDREFAGWRNAAQHRIPYFMLPPSDPVTLPQNLVHLQ